MQIQLNFMPTTYNYFKHKIQNKTCFTSAIKKNESPQSEIDGDQDFLLASLASLTVRLEHAKRFSASNAAVSKSAPETVHRHI